MAAATPAPVCDARILVTGPGRGDAAARAVLRAELRDVRYAPEPADLGGVDMLVYVADACEVPDRERIAALARRAREAGALVSAVLVSADALTEDSPLLAALRDAADNVMIVRDAGSVAAILRALR